MELYYSQKPKSEARTAKSMGRDINVSFKKAVIVCDKIRGMKLSDAKGFLSEVIALRKPVPFKRFQKGTGHRKGQGKNAIGKYPVKASREILLVLDNVERNAEYKGLDTENLRIIHAQAQKGISRSKRKPKGRYRLRKTQLVNVQVIVKEGKPGKSPEKAKKTEAKAEHHPKKPEHDKGQPAKEKPQKETGEKKSEEHHIQHKKQEKVKEKAPPGATKQKAAEKTPPAKKKEEAEPAHGHKKKEDTKEEKTKEGKNSESQ